ncbi:PLP-dependent aminotransferase family protein [Inhella sp.]|uniref:aminotransferase-like domain-containing protein n=1 Tax=Inhella sp. TaxID=1921806 RepID=UPI0035B44C0B
MWIPQLVEGDGPIYLRLADTLRRDIQQGVLEAGERLPTLKELAAALGITPGTVGRAYQAVHREGLVSGEVGRGTFVCERALPPPGAPAAPAVLGLDMSIVKPNAALQESFVRAALAELAQSARLPDMLDYTPDGANSQHLQAGAQWLQEAGLAAQPEQVLLTCGGQHGLWLAVAALTRPGDLVLCESLCYPGVASVVQLLGRRLRGVPMDAQGLQPEALRALCEQERPALLICIPNLQNPTGTTLPLERRRQIAALAREFDFKLVDDDLYGFLASEPLPPLASFAPERTLYLTSLSKSVASTVRLGYVHAPPQWLTALAAAVRSSVWMVSPLLAELATQLIRSGKARDMAHRQREEAQARQTLARAYLGGLNLRAHPTAFHLWLELPQAWSSGDQFAALARGHQLIVAAGDSFSMNRDGEGRRHVRLALMDGSRERLEYALTKLAGLAASPDAVWL